MKEKDYIKIVSGGFGNNTKVINTRTGNEIANVAEVTWGVAAGGIARAGMILIKVPVEVEGDANVVETTAMGRDSKRYEYPRENE